MHLRTEVTCVAACLSPPLVLPAAIARAHSREAVTCDNVTSRESEQPLSDDSRTPSVTDEQRCFDEQRKGLYAATARHRNSLPQVTKAAISLVAPQDLKNWIQDSAMTAEYPMCQQYDNCDYVPP